MGKTLLKKIAFSGVMASFALIAFMLENLLPPLLLPGARLGLSNVFILLTALLMGDVYAIGVFIVKVTLGSLISGNISAVLYSLPAGLIALTAQLILFRFYKKFGVISVSVFGGGINLVLQNVAFAIITNSYLNLVYLPYFALIGISSGGVIGVIVYFTNKKLPKTLFTFETEKKH